MPDKTDSHRFLRSKPFEYLVLIVVAVLVAVGVRTFVMQTNYIPSPSMERTLLENDKVVVNKVLYRFRGPQRGEIVVFRPPSSWGAAPGEEEYIKRVIGVGGDRVVCCDAQQRLTVNGYPLAEEYLYPGDVPSTDEFDVTVPQGRLFFMGDHRSDSADSRAHLEADLGTVPVGRVTGRAFAIYWPMSRWGGLSIPDTFAEVPSPR